MVMSVLENTNILLESKNSSTLQRWQIVNDGVMGGLSQSKMILNDDGFVNFYGNVSLKNNGGFASLRAYVDDIKFEGFNGVEIRLKGDGKKYGFTIRQSRYFTGYSFNAGFETNRDQWQTIRIPFEEFKLRFYGRSVNNNSIIAPDKIQQLGIIISDKQAGDFNLIIDHIKLFK